MRRWTSSFKEDCRQGTGNPADLHQRFRATFLARFGEILERYYALATFLLAGISFKLWFDRINLSRSAYEVELYPLIVAAVPLLGAIGLSTVYYEGALEAAAQRALNPETFRYAHRTHAFYIQTLTRSIYFPIMVLLALSIVAFGVAYKLRLVPMS
jgi:hypothetical protein